MIFGIMFILSADHWTNSSVEIDHWGLWRKSIVLEKLKLHLCTNKNSLKLVMLSTTLWSRYDLTIPPSMIIVAVASCTWFFAVYPLLREDASCHFRCMLQPFTSAWPKEPEPPISSPNGEDVGPVEEVEGRDESLGSFCRSWVVW